MPALAWSLRRVLAMSLVLSSHWAAAQSRRVPPRLEWIEPGPC